MKMPLLLKAVYIRFCQAIFRHAQYDQFGHKFRPPPSQDIDVVAQIKAVVVRNIFIESYINQKARQFTFKLFDIQANQL